MHHAANGRDAGTCGDEHSILRRLAQGKESVRTVELYRRALFQITKPVRQEAMIHAVQAEIEGGVRTRRRGYGIRPSVFLAIKLWLLNGDELPGHEAEFIQALNGELQMFGLRREPNGSGQSTSEHLPLEGCALLGLGLHDSDYLDALRLRSTRSRVCQQRTLLAQHDSEY